MKKRYILFALTALIAFAACIMPALIERITNEQNHRGFALAFEATKKLSDDYIDIYRNAGVNTIIFDEEKNKFNEELISFYREKGFDIALRIYVGGLKVNSYEANLDKLVKDNDIKYIVLRRNKRVPYHEAPLADIINDNKITLVVNENMNQLSNEMPVGYEKYVEAADGRIMRAYETLKNPTGTLSKGSTINDFGNLIFHHMINSIRDRNTEFMFVNQLEVPSLSEEEAVRNTASAIEKFYSWVGNIGYVEHKEPDLSGYRVNMRVTGAAAALLGVLMVMVMAEIVFKRQSSVFEYIMYSISLMAFALSFVMPQSLISLYPTVFAPLASCFAFSVSVYASEQICRKSGFLISHILVFAVSLAVLFCGAAVMGALLGGVDYYLNNLIFRGVKLTLLLPVTFAAVASWIYIFDGKIGISLSDVKSYIKKVKLWHFMVLALVLLAAGIYVVRSGNSQISSFENSIRNFIAEISNARPRTKEFLIGYPLLALSVYYTKYSYNKLIKWVVYSGSSILFSSVINTFCHVFTDFSISSLRTVNGLVFSLPFIVLVLSLNKIFVRYILKK